MLQICPLDITFVAQEETQQLPRLFSEAFGPGRFTRAAYRVREAAGKDATVWFGAKRDDIIVGALGMTPIRCGGHCGYLLGPVAVRKSDQRNFVGAGLIGHAATWAEAADSQFILLVGDLAYYGRFGFAPVPQGQVTFPGPVDPARILARCVAPFSPPDISGEVRGLSSSRQPAPGAIRTGS